MQYLTAPQVATTASTTTLPTMPISDMAAVPLTSRVNANRSLLLLNRLDNNAISSGK
jgi:hypothetical protein